MAEILLTRLSAQYSEMEDRIRLMGEGGQGATVEMWCTQRLLGLVVGHLAGLLEQQVTQAVPAQARVQGVPASLSSAEQTYATATYRNEAPVQVAPSAKSWLVHTIDIHRRGAIIRVVFKGNNDAAAMDYDPMLLRQWLHILFTLYGKAGWPRQMWPEWIATPSTAPVQKVKLQ